MTENKKELARRFKKHNITARKFCGDDRYSWAVFVDKRPVMTGLGRNEVDYYKRQALKRLEDAIERLGEDK